jgi:DNA-binding LacI/PurR family transcriptional regulator
VRCPEDVAVATFDDLVGDRAFHPRLTAVSQPGYEIGARGATLLMDRIEGKLTKKQSVLRVAPTLIVRESTRGRISAERAFLSGNLESYQKTPISSS